MMKAGKQIDMSEGWRRRRALWPLGILLAFSLVGCKGEDWAKPQPIDPIPMPAQLDGSGLGLAPPLPETQVAKQLEQARQRDVVFHIMMVKVPQEKRDATEPIWSHLRSGEDLVDGEDALRIRQNGIRFGVGNVRSWDAITAAIDAINGRHINDLQPYRIPPKAPLHLELDDSPRDQTVWYFDYNGLANGDTWRDSLGAIQLTHSLDEVSPDRDWVRLLPMIYQKREGTRNVQTRDGLWSVPQYEGKLYEEAAVRVGLDPGEFVVIAPAKQADIDDLLGSVLLTTNADGLAYDYCIFIRPEVMHVGPHN